MGRDLLANKERDYRKARKFCLQQDPQGGPSYDIAYVNSEAPRIAQCLPCHTDAIARGLFQQARGLFPEGHLSEPSLRLSCEKYTRLPPKKRRRNYPGAFEEMGATPLLDGYICLFKGKKHGELMLKNESFVSNHSCTLK